MMPETDTTDVAMTEDPMTEDPGPLDDEDDSMTREELKQRVEELEQENEMILDFANSVFQEIQSLTQSVNKERELFQRRLQDTEE